MGLAILGLEVVTIISNNIAALVRADTTSVVIFFNFIINKTCAAVPGGRNTNTPTSPSPIVVCYAIGHPTYSNQLNESFIRHKYYNSQRNTKSC